MSPSLFDSEESSSSMARQHLNFSCDNTFSEGSNSSVRNNLNRFGNSNLSSQSKTCDRNLSLSNYKTNNTLTTGNTDFVIIDSSSEDENDNNDFNTNNKKTNAPLPKVNFSVQNDDNIVILSDSEQEDDIIDEEEIERVRLLITRKTNAAKAEFQRQIMFPIPGCSGIQSIKHAQNEPNQQVELNTSLPKTLSETIENKTDSAEVKNISPSENKSSVASESCLNNHNDIFNISNQINDYNKESDNSKSIENLCENDKDISNVINIDPDIKDVSNQKINKELSETSEKSTNKDLIPLNCLQDIEEAMSSTSLETKDEYSTNLIKLDNKLSNLNIGSKSLTSIPQSLSSHLSQENNSMGLNSNSKIDQNEKSSSGNLKSVGNKLIKSQILPLPTTLIEIDDKNISDSQNDTKSSFKEPNHIKTQNLSESTISSQKTQKSNSINVENKESIGNSENIKNDQSNLSLTTSIKNTDTVVFNTNINRKKSVGNNNYIDNNNMSIDKEIDPLKKNISEKNFNSSNKYGNLEELKDNESDILDGMQNNNQKNFNENTTLTSQRVVFSAASTSSTTKQASLKISTSKILSKFSNSSKNSLNKLDSKNSQNLKIIKKTDYIDEPYAISTQKAINDNEKNDSFNNCNLSSLKVSDNIEKSIDLITSNEPKKDFDEKTQLVENLCENIKQQEQEVILEEQKNDVLLNEKSIDLSKKTISFPDLTANSISIDPLGFESNIFNDFDNNKLLKSSNESITINKNDISKPEINDNLNLVKQPTEIINTIQYEKEKTNENSETKIISESLISENQSKKSEKFENEKILEVLQTLPDIASVEDNDTERKNIPTNDAPTEIELKNEPTEIELKNEPTEIELKNEKAKCENLTDLLENVSLHDFSINKILSSDSTSEIHTGENKQLEIETKAQLPNLEESSKINTNEIQKTSIISIPGSTGDSIQGFEALENEKIDSKDEAALLKSSELFQKTDNEIQKSLNVPIVNSVNDLIPEIQISDHKKQQCENIMELPIKSQLFEHSAKDMENNIDPVQKIQRFETEKLECQNKTEISESLTYQSSKDVVEIQKTPIAVIPSTDVCDSIPQVQKRDDKELEDNNVELPKLQPCVSPTKGGNEIPKITMETVPTAGNDSISDIESPGNEKLNESDIMKIESNLLPMMAEDNLIGLEVEIETNENFDFLDTPLLRGSLSPINDELENIILNTTNILNEVSGDSFETVIFQDSMRQSTPEPFVAPNADATLTNNLYTKKDNENEKIENQTEKSVTVLPKLKESDSIHILDECSQKLIQSQRQHDYCMGNSAIDFESKEVKFSDEKSKTTKNDAKIPSTISTTLVKSSSEIMNPEKTSNIQNDIIKSGTECISNFKENSSVDMNINKEFGLNINESNINILDVLTKVSPQNKNSTLNDDMVKGISNISSETISHEVDPTRIKSQYTGTEPDKSNETEYIGETKQIIHTSKKHEKEIQNSFESIKKLNSKLHRSKSDLMKTGNKTYSKLDPHIDFPTENDITKSCENKISPPISKNSSMANKFGNLSYDTKMDCQKNDIQQERNVIFPDKNNIKFESNKPDNDSFKKVDKICKDEQTIKGKNSLGCENENLLQSKILKSEKETLKDSFENEITSEKGKKDQKDKELVNDKVLNKESYFNQENKSISEIANPLNQTPTKQVENFINNNLTPNKSPPKHLKAGQKINEIAEKIIKVKSDKITKNDMLTNNCPITTLGDTHVDKEITHDPDNNTKSVKHITIQEYLREEKYRKVSKSKCEETKIGSKIEPSQMIMDSSDITLKSKPKSGQLFPEAPKQNMPEYNDRIYESSGSKENMNCPENLSNILNISENINNMNNSSKKDIVFDLNQSLSINGTEPKHEAVKATVKPAKKYTFTDNLQIQIKTNQKPIVEPTKIDQREKIIKDRISEKNQTSSKIDKIDIKDNRKSNKFVEQNDSKIDLNKDVNNFPMKILQIPKTDTKNNSTILEIGSKKTSKDENRQKLKVIIQNMDLAKTQFAREIQPPIPQKAKINVKEELDKSKKNIKNECEEITKSSNVKHKEQPTMKEDKLISNLKGSISENDILLKNKVPVNRFNGKKISNKFEVPKEAEKQNWEIKSKRKQEHSRFENISNEINSKKEILNHENDFKSKEVVNLPNNVIKIKSKFENRKNSEKVIDEINEQSLPKINKIDSHADLKPKMKEFVEVNKLKLSTSIIKMSDNKKEDSDKIKNNKSQNEKSKSVKIQQFENNINDLLSKQKSSAMHDKKMERDLPSIKLNISNKDFKDKNREQYTKMKNSSESVSKKNSSISEKFNEPKENPNIKNKKDNNETNIINKPIKIIKKTHSVEPLKEDKKKEKNLSNKFEKQANKSIKYNEKDNSKHLKDRTSLNEVKEKNDKKDGKKQPEIKIKISSKDKYERIEIKDKKESKKQEDIKIEVRDKDRNENLKKISTEIIKLSDNKDPGSKDRKTNLLSNLSNKIERKSHKLSLKLDKKDKETKQSGSTESLTRNKVNDKSPSKETNEIKLKEIEKESFKVIKSTKEDKEHLNSSSGKSYSHSKEPKEKTSNKTSSKTDLNKAKEINKNNLAEINTINNISVTEENTKKYQNEQKKSNTTSPIKVIINKLMLSEKKTINSNSSKTKNKEYYVTDKSAIEVKTENKQSLDLAKVNEVKDTKESFKNEKEDIGKHRSAITKEEPKEPKIQTNEIPNQLTSDIGSNKTSNNKRQYDETMKDEKNDVQSPPVPNKILKSSPPLTASNKTDQPSIQNETTNQPNANDLKDKSTKSSNVEKSPTQNDKQTLDDIASPAYEKIVAEDLAGVKKIFEKKPPVIKSKSNNASNETEILDENVNEEIEPPNVNDNDNIVNKNLNVVNEPPHETDTLDAVNKPNDFVNESVDVLNKLLDGVNEPVDIVGENLNIVREPLNIVKESVDVVNKLLDVVNDHVDAANKFPNGVNENEPLDTVKEPLDIVRIPIDVVNEPVDVVNQPLNDANELLDGVNKAPDVINESADIVKEPIEINPTPEINAEMPSKIDENSIVAPEVDEINATNDVKNTENIVDEQNKTNKIDESNDLSILDPFESSSQTTDDMAPAVLPCDTSTTSYTPPTRLPEFTYDDLEKILRASEMEARKYDENIIQEDKVSSSETKRKRRTTKKNKNAKNKTPVIPVVVNQDKCDDNPIDEVTSSTEMLSSPQMFYSTYIGNNRLDSDQDDKPGPIKLRIMKGWRGSKSPEKNTSFNTAPVPPTPEPKPEPEPKEPEPEPNPNPDPLEITTNIPKPPTSPPEQQQPVNPQTEINSNLEFFNDIIHGKAAKKNAKGGGRGKKRKRKATNARNKKQLKLERDDDEVEEVIRKNKRQPVKPSLNDSEILAANSIQNNTQEAADDKKTFKEDNYFQNYNAQRYSGRMTRNTCSQFEKGLIEYDVRNVLYESCTKKRGRRGQKTTNDDTSSISTEDNFPISANDNFPTTVKDVTENIENPNPIVETANVAVDQESKEDINCGQNDNTRRNEIKEVLETLKDFSTKVEMTNRTIVEHGKTENCSDSPKNSISAQVMGQETHNFENPNRVSITSMQDFADELGEDDNDKRIETDSQKEKVINAIYRKNSTTQQEVNELHAKQRNSNLTDMQESPYLLYKLNKMNSPKIYKSTKIPPQTASANQLKTNFDPTNCLVKLKRYEKNNEKIDKDNELFQGSTENKTVINEEFPLIDTKMQKSKFNSNKFIKSFKPTVNSDDNSENNFSSKDEHVAVLDVLTKFNKEVSKLVTQDTFEPTPPLQPATSNIQQRNASLTSQQLNRFSPITTHHKIPSPTVVNTNLTSYFLGSLDRQQMMLNNSQNITNIPQSIPNIHQNIPNIHQNIPNIHQNIPNIHQSIHIPQSIPNIPQTIPNNQTFPSNETTDSIGCAPFFPSYLDLLDTVQSTTMPDGCWLDSTPDRQRENTDLLEKFINEDNENTIRISTSIKPDYEFNDSIGKNTNDSTNSLKNTKSSIILPGKLDNISQNFNQDVPIIIPDVCLNDNTLIDAKLEARNIPILDEPVENKRLSADKNFVGTRLPKVPQFNETSGNNNLNKKTPLMFVEQKTINENSNINKSQKQQQLQQTGYLKSASDIDFSQTSANAVSFDFQKSYEEFAATIKLKEPYDEAVAADKTPQMFLDKNEKIQSPKARVISQHIVKEPTKNIIPTYATNKDFANSEHKNLPDINTNNIENIGRNSPITVNNTPIGVKRKFSQQGDMNSSKKTRSKTKEIDHLNDSCINKPQTGIFIVDTDDLSTPNLIVKQNKKINQFCKEYSNQKQQKSMYPSKTDSESIVIPSNKSKHNAAKSHNHSNSSDELLQLTKHNKNTISNNDIQNNNTAQSLNSRKQQSTSGSNHSTYSPLNLAETPPLKSCLHDSGKPGSARNGPKKRVAFIK